MKILSASLLAITILTGPASAVEQCRFIQAKAEREACYKRQEDDVAAKRLTEADRQAKLSDFGLVETPQQLSKDDETMNRSIRGNCRGC